MENISSTNRSDADYKVYLDKYRNVDIEAASENVELEYCENMYMLPALIGAGVMTVSVTATTKRELKKSPVELLSESIRAV